MTTPPTVCPRGPANDTANLVAGILARKSVTPSLPSRLLLVMDDGSMVAEIDSKSKRPLKVMAVLVVGCWNETLETIPEPDNTQRPVVRLLHSRVMAATISDPSETSRTYGDIAGSGSRVTETDGFGLFLDPGGRPLGRRTTSMDASSLVV